MITLSSQIARVLMKLIMMIQVKTFHLYSVKDGVKSSLSQVLQGYHLQAKQDGVHLVAIVLKMGTFVFYLLLMLELIRMERLVRLLEMGMIHHHLHVVLLLEHTMQLYQALTRISRQDIKITKWIVLSI